MPRPSARSLWAKHLSGESASKIKANPQARQSLSSEVQSKPFQGVVLGVDPSVRGTGLAVLEFSGKNRPRLLATSTVRVQPKHDLPYCLGEIFKVVSGVIAAWPVEHAALEETIYVQNFRTAQRLGAARGAAIAALAVAGLPVFEYPPLRIKQATVGYGRASKEQVIRQVASLLGSSNNLPSDEADAAAVAICHAFTYKPSFIPPN